MSRQAYKYLLLVIPIIMLAIAPHWLGIYWLQMLIYVLWISYLGSAWALVLHGGLFSLMHGLFLGAGAYAPVLLWSHLGISPWLGMLAGLAVAMLLAISLGWLILRREIPLLAFAAMTLALSFIGVFIINNTSFLGMSIGIPNFSPTDNPWNYQWINDLPYYYIILVMAIGVLALSHFILKSKLGLRLRASAENPRAAAMSGVDILRTRLTALGMSAALISMGGTFWAQYSKYVDPTSLVGPHMVITLALVVMIGGSGSVWGPVLGASIVIPSTWLLRTYFGTNVAGIDTMVYGLGVLLVFRFLGTGILPWVKQYRLRKLVREESAN